MDAPLIAVTASLTAAKGGRPERAGVNTAYLHAVELSGGIPAIVTPGSPDTVVAQLLARCGGLMLTGGGDVAPARYREPPLSETRFVSPERDAMEFATLEWALARDLPVLALCRGMQVLNVALEGTLWQDLPSQHPSDIRHNQTEPRDTTTHEVRLSGSSTACQVMGDQRVSTNSLHHQGLKALGRGLEAVGWTDDDVVEAVEAPGYRFVLGVQWHPEELVASHEHARRLFAAFVEAAREGK